MNSSEQNKDWKKYLMELFNWFFSRSPLEKEHKNETERLKSTMKTTLASRYNASLRLKNQSTFTFITTTVLSLGLIFIPLIQNANVKLALSNGVLNAMQIFLAVSILVYSVITGTAHYDLRSERLNDCGDKLKSLLRELRRESEDKNPLEKERLAHFQQRYSDISTDGESHSRNDFRFTILQLPEQYKVVGIPLLWRWLVFGFFAVIPYFPSIFLLFIEFTFISDMLGKTTIFAVFHAQ